MNHDIVFFGDEVMLLKTVVFMFLWSFGLTAQQSLSEFDRLLRSNSIEGMPLEVFLPYKETPGSLEMAISRLKDSQSCSNSSFALGRFATKESLEAILIFFKSPIMDDEDKALRLNFFECKVDAIFSLGVIRKYSTSKELKKIVTKNLESLSSPNDSVWNSITWSSPRHNSKKEMIFYLSSKAKLVLKNSE